MIRWFTLLCWCSAGYRWAMLRAGVGAVCASGLTIAMLALVESSASVVTAELLGGGDQLRVSPPSVALGPVDLAGSVLPERGLSEGNLTKLRALDGVSEVWPEAWSRFPVVLRGDVLGIGMRSDAAMLGAATAAVREDFTGEWSWTPGQPVPVLAPRSLLAVFNGSFAPANGLPRLRDSAILGRKFTISAGESSFGRSLDNPQQLQAKVVGVTAYGGSLAAIVPLEVIAWLDDSLKLDSPGRVSSAMILLDPAASASEVQGAAQALGWMVEDMGGAARQVAATIEVIERGVGLLGLVLVAAALLGVSQVYGVLLGRRQRDFAILRVLGTKPSWLIRGMIIEVSAAALTAVGLGLLVGWCLAQAAGGWMGSVLSELLGFPVVLSPALPISWSVLLVLGAVPMVLAASLPAIMRVLADARA